LTVVVTGAGSGIGLRLAELLGMRGESLIALDMSFSDPVRSRLDTAVPGGGERFRAIEVDVREGDAVRAAFGQAVAAIGPPSLVINCAGVLDPRPFGEISEADWRRVIDINLIGSRNVAAAALEVLPEGGRLVLMASLAGLLANYGYSSYCASKFGVVALAEVLRLEYKPRGIEVSVICPPEIETPMVWEERRIVSRPSARLKRLAGTLELEPAADMILEGIDRGEFMIIPGRRGQVLALTRLLPRGLNHVVSDLIVKRALR
jgi:3-dehydrosphinganine reductase